MWRKRPRKAKRKSPRRKNHLLVRKRLTRMKTVMHNHLLKKVKTKRHPKQERKERLRKKRTKAFLKHQSRHDRLEESRSLQALVQSSLLRPNLKHSQLNLTTWWISSVQLQLRIHSNSNQVVSALCNNSNNSSHNSNRTTTCSGWAWTSNSHSSLKTSQTCLVAWIWEFSNNRCSNLHSSKTCLEVWTWVVNSRSSRIHNKMFNRLPQCSKVLTLEPSNSRSSLSRHNLARPLASWTRSLHNHNNLLNSHQICLADSTCRQTLRCRLRNNHQRLQILSAISLLLQLNHRHSRSLPICLVDCRLAPSPLLHKRLKHLLLNHSKSRSSIQRIRVCSVLTISRRNRLRFSRRKLRMTNIIISLRVTSICFSRQSLMTLAT